MALRMSGVSATDAPTSGRVAIPETFQRGGCAPGVYVKPDSPLISVLGSIEGLASWAGLCFVLLYLEVCPRPCDIS